MSPIVLFFIGKYSYPPVVVTWLNKTFHTEMVNSVLNIKIYYGELLESMNKYLYLKVKLNYWFVKGRKTYA